MVLFKSISPPLFPHKYCCDTKLGRKVSLILLKYYILGGGISRPVKCEIIDQK